MELPTRKRIRLKSYDYSNSGMYFITVCTKNRQKLFGEIIQEDDSARIILSETGKCIERIICEIPEHYNNVSVEKHCIMPDHIHMIICLNADTGGRMVSAPTSNPPSVSQIVGSMKRRASYIAGCGLWQKSFYEHIIRNYNNYLEIAQYIDNNPIKALLS